MWWPAVVKSEWELSQFPLRHDYGRSPHAYVNHRLQIQLELLMISSMPLETCWAFNERRINKFYYKVASCWLFLLSYITMHGSMNIELAFIFFRFALYILFIYGLSTLFNKLKTANWTIFSVYIIFKSCHAASNISFITEILIQYRDSTIHHSLNICHL
jgi:hypothetical protein